ncbi:MAG: hypothetical protein IPH76_12830 [Xanthomonadales bacterium]|nr:hypothetical protein [Xanthomonadales bacterium]
MATLTVAAGQRITGSAVGVFAHASSNTVPVSFSLCISYDNGVTLYPFYTATYPDGTVLESPKKTALAAAASVVVASSGTVKVGYCVKNKSTTGITLGSNDYVNGWFMVSN